MTRKVNTDRLTAEIERRGIEDFYRYGDGMKNTPPGGIKDLIFEKNGEKGKSISRVVREKDCCPFPAMSPFMDGLIQKNVADGRQLGGKSKRWTEGKDKEEQSGKDEY
jgi:hypothetical protein